MNAPTARRTDEKICADDENNNLQTLVLHLDAIPEHALRNRVGAAQDLGIRAGDNVLVWVCSLRGVPVHALQLIHQRVSRSECAYACTHSGKRRWPVFSTARPHRVWGGSSSATIATPYTCMMPTGLTRSSGRRLQSRQSVYLFSSLPGTWSGFMATARHWNMVALFWAKYLPLKIFYFFQKNDRAWTQATCSLRSSSSPAGMCARRGIQNCLVIVGMAPPARLFSACSHRHRC